MTLPVYDAIPGTGRDNLADLAVTSKAQSTVIDTNFARTNTYLGNYRATTYVTTRQNTHTGAGNWTGGWEIPWGAWWPPITMTLPANPRQLVVNLNAVMRTDGTTWMYVYAILSGTGLTMGSYNLCRVGTWTATWMGVGDRAIVDSAFLIGGGQVTLTPSYTVGTQQCFCHGATATMLVVV